MKNEKRWIWMANTRPRKSVNCDWTVTKGAKAVLCTKANAAGPRRVASVDFSPAFQRRDIAQYATSSRQRPLKNDSFVADATKIAWHLGAIPAFKGRAKFSRRNATPEVTVLICAKVDFLCKARKQCRFRRKRYKLPLPDRDLSFNRAVRRILRVDCTTWSSLARQGV